MSTRALVTGVLVALLLVAVAVVGLTGPMGKSQAILDLEQRIDDHVTLITQVESIVGCPEDAVYEPGATFECWVAQASGQTGLAVVTIDEAGVATWVPKPNRP